MPKPDDEKEEKREQGVARSLYDEACKKERKALTQKDDFETKLKDALRFGVSGIWYPLNENNNRGDRKIVAERFARWARSLTLDEVEKAWEDATKEYNAPPSGFIKGAEREAVEGADAIIAFGRKLKSLRALSVKQKGTPFSAEKEGEAKK